MSLIPQPPVMIELPPLVRGDTWDGVYAIGPVTFNGGPPPSTLVSVLWHFRRNWRDLAPAYVLTSELPLPDGQGTIEIVDDVLWQLRIPAQPLPLDVRTWFFDLQFTDSLGVIFTPVGGSLVVARDYTHV